MGDFPGARQCGLMPQFQVAGVQGVHCSIVGGYKNPVVGNGELGNGAAPHGGIAPGIDRLVAMLTGAGSLRKVIAFPKTQSGSDLLFGAPAPVDAGQLRDLPIRVDG